MTDKQINIVEILAEQCKNCTLYEGDTISLTISIFDRPLRGVCFDNNIYFSVDELNYIMQKLISKEQECEELKEGYSELTDIVSPYMDDFTGYNEELGGFDIVLCVKELIEQLDQLKAENEGFKILHKSDKGLITSTGKQNYQLLQEYDKLKAENDECIKDNEYLKTIIKDFTQEVVKLKATLTEIKEIAEKNLNIHTCAFKGCGYDLITKQILQKISECEGNNE